jgi:hypothetical protein
VKKIYSIFIAALFLMVLNLAATAQAKDFSPLNRPDLTGTWLLDIECDCGAAAKANMPMINKVMGSNKALTELNTQEPFNAVSTFNSDGTFSENTFADYLAPQGTPARGVWERINDRQFAVTFYGVLVGSVTDPEFQGTYKVRWKVTINSRGEHLSGPYVADIYAPDGSAVFSFGGTAEGRRARVERLP